VESGKRQKKQQESKEATHKRAELYHMEHGKLLKFNRDPHHSREFTYLKETLSN
jgi:hypothetical protein